MAQDTQRTSFESASSILRRSSRNRTIKSKLKMLVKAGLVLLLLLIVAIALQVAPPLTDTRNWIVASTFDEKSPLWISREVFQNLVAAFIGVIISVSLVAPLTARRVIWENRRKWGEARRIAEDELLSSIQLLLSDIIFTCRDAPERKNIQLNAIPISQLNSKSKIQILRDILDSYKRLEQTYLRWGEVWTPEQHSAIAKLVYLLRPFSESILGAIVLSLQLPSEARSVNFHIYEQTAFGQSWLNCTKLAELLPVVFSVMEADSSDELVVLMEYRELDSNAIANFMYPILREACPVEGNPSALEIVEAFKPTE